MISTETGILFDKYKILECIKKSEYGAVYLCEYSGIKVIVKTLQKQSGDEKENERRFKREAQILKSLKHKNIINIIDFNAIEENYYITFEYFESKNLRSFINVNLPYEKKKKIIAQLLEGLNYLHANNIVHRDLKPENILVDKNLNVRISDFGLALALNDNFTTQLNSIVGTPCYMSPEQIKGKKLNYSSDLFSIGTVIYELLTGKNLFLSDDFNRTINNILNFIEDELEEKLNGIENEMAVLLKGLLSNEPSARFESAADAIDILISKDNKKYKSGKNKYLYYAATVIFIVVISSIIFILNYDIKTQNLEMPRTSSDSNPAIIEKTDAQKVEEELPQNQETVNPGTVVTENKLIVTDNQDQTTEPNISENNKIEQSSENLFGQLRIGSYPWSHIYLDSEKIGTTPIDEPLTLTAGIHVLKFVHPDYPEIEKEISITKNSTVDVNINFPEYFGYLNCKVFPWGDIYINNKFITQTPLEKIIILEPGEYFLTIKNPGYEDYNSKIDLLKNDTLIIDHTFSKN